jgi:hypothetical protein
VRAGELSAVWYELRAVLCALSAVWCELSAVLCELSAVLCELSALLCELNCAQGTLTTTQGERIGELLPKLVRSDSNKDSLVKSRIQFADAGACHELTLITFSGQVPVSGLKRLHKGPSGKPSGRSD